MKTMFVGLMCLLIPSVVCAQTTTIRIETEGQRRIREDQAFAEKVFEQQGRNKAEWIKSQPIREWTLTNKSKPKNFDGRFLMLKNDEALIQTLDGSQFAISMRVLCSADQKFIREEIASRKGIKKKPAVTKKKPEVVTKPVSK